MLVVLAHRSDRGAQALVDRWKPYGARLLTAADLCVCGWRHSLAAPEEGVAVVDGEQVRASDIRGVLTRLSRISENDLTEIVPRERPYAAAETNAFLLAWLSALPCRVINRPTPTGLNGPNWRPEQWALAAVQSGIPIRDVRRPAVLEPEPLEVTVIVLGNSCLGTADGTLAEQALRLARIAGTEFLAVRFSQPEAPATFTGASLWPDVDDPETADALRTYLQTDHTKQG
jgi:hypothetical protein